MALNRIYAGIETEQRTRKVGSNVAPGTPLLISGIPVVTLTGSGDYINTSTVVAGGKTIVTSVQGGGVGLEDDEATVTPSGTFAFDVVGSSVTAAYDVDGNGAPVYITDLGVLTLTALDNTAFGVVDFFRGETSATDTAVKIGVTL